MFAISAVRIEAENKTFSLREYWHQPVSACLGALSSVCLVEKAVLSAPSWVS